MRTTLSIDDDILSAAKHLAERQSTTIGDVISTLARQGLQRGARGPRATPKVMRNGVTLLQPRGAAAPVTLELVNQLRDEMP